MDYELRQATLDDQPILRQLIARSIRALGAGDYSQEQIEAALQGAFGVDSGGPRAQSRSPSLTPWQPQRKPRTAKRRRVDAD